MVTLSARLGRGRGHGHRPATLLVLISVAWSLWPSLARAAEDDDNFKTVVRVNKETSACRYKVWYLEACDPREHVQIVHLILSKGGTNCEINKHLTKVCVPSKDNDHPVTPEKAMFKPLLVSKDHSPRALAEIISKTNSSDLPDVLLPQSANKEDRQKAEEVLLRELKDFEAAQQRAKNAAAASPSLSTPTPLAPSPSPHTADNKPDLIFALDKDREVNRQETLRQLLERERDRKVEREVLDTLLDMAPGRRPLEPEKVKIESEKDGGRKRAAEVTKRTSKRPPATLTGPEEKDDDDEGMLSKLMNIFNRDGSAEMSTATTTTPPLVSTTAVKDAWNDISGKGQRPGNRRLGEDGMDAKDKEFMDELKKQLQQEPVPGGGAGKMGPGPKPEGLGGPKGGPKGPGAPPLGPKGPSGANLQSKGERPDPIAPKPSSRPQEAMDHPQTLGDVFRSKEAPPNEGKKDKPRVSDKPKMDETEKARIGELLREVSAQEATMTTTESTTRTTMRSTSTSASTGKSSDSENILERLLQDASSSSSASETPKTDTTTKSTTESTTETKTESTTPTTAAATEKSNSAPKIDKETITTGGSRERNSTEAGNDLQNHEFRYLAQQRDSGRRQPPPARPTPSEVPSLPPTKVTVEGLTPEEINRRLKAKNKALKDREDRLRKMEDELAQEFIIRDLDKDIKKRERDAGQKSWTQGTTKSVEPGQRPQPTPARPNSKERLPKWSGERWKSNEDPKWKEKMVENHHEGGKGKHIPKRWQDEHSQKWDGGKTSGEKWKQDFPKSKGENDAALWKNQGNMKKGIPQKSWKEAHSKKWEKEADWKGSKEPTWKGNPKTLSEKSKGTADWRDQPAVQKWKDIPRTWQERDKNVGKWDPQKWREEKSGKGIEGPPVWKSGEWKEKRNGKGGKWREKEGMSPKWKGEGKVAGASGENELAGNLNLNSWQAQPNGSHIINWMIRNMPEGKQTIVVL